MLDYDCRAYNDSWIDVTRDGNIELIIDRDPLPLYLSARANPKKEYVFEKSAG